MLKARVITALVLVALLLPAIFMTSPMVWAVLVALVMGIAAWEWGALLAFSARARVVLGVLTALLCAGLAILNPAVVGSEAAFQPGATWVWFFYGAAAVLWCGVMPVWLKRQWSLSAWSGLLVGAVVLLPTWLAMVQLRMLGPWAMLAVFAVVWVADIAAYFAGRAFGKHKLAPTISPGKTREGAYGACLGVVAYGLLVRHFAGIDGPPLPLWVAGLLVVTAISIIGDLFESLLKRKAGIKDSSAILPGHGGVLDRIDSLTSTLPCVALVWLLLSYSA